MVGEGEAVGSRRIVGHVDGVEDVVQFPSPDAVGFGFREKLDKVAIIDLKDRASTHGPCRGYLLKDLVHHDLVPPGSVSPDGVLMIDLLVICAGSKAVELAVAAELRRLGHRPPVIVVVDDDSRFPSTSHARHLPHVHILADFTDLAQTLEGLFVGVVLETPQCSDWGTRNSGRSAAQPAGAPDPSERADARSQRNAKANAEVEWLTLFNSITLLRDQDSAIVIESTENCIKFYPSFAKMITRGGFDRWGTSACAYGQTVSCKIVGHPLNFWLKNMPWSPRPRCSVATPCGHDHQLVISGASGGLPVSYASTPYPTALADDLGGAIAQRIIQRRLSFFSNLDRNAAAS